MSIIFFKKYFYRPYLQIILICSMLLYVGYHFDIAPLRKQLAMQQKKAKTIRKETSTLLYKQLTLEQQAMELPETKKILDEWQKKMIKSTHLKELLNQITTIGKNEKLQFNFFTQAKKIKENDYIKLPLYLSVVGPYEKTAHFINQVAHLPWMVIVGDFTVSRLWQEGLFATELVLDIYYLD